MTPTAIAALLDWPVFGLLMRALLTLPYWWSGLSKLGDLQAAVAEAQHFDLHPSWLVVLATIAVQIGASALLVIGRMAWLGAGALGVFTLAATFIAHAFWTLDDPQARLHDFNTFLEHLGLIGGLALAAIQAHHGARQ
jgi:uncharacterized membrane protein YphA (DoxX/SURF4 family)